MNNYILLSFLLLFLLFNNFTESFTDNIHQNDNNKYLFCKNDYSIQENKFDNPLKNKTMKNICSSTNSFTYQYFPNETILDCENLPGKPGACLVGDLRTKNNDKFILKDPFYPHPSPNDNYGILYNESDTKKMLDNFLSNNENKEYDDLRDNIDSNN